ncbi:hypothetical protein A7U43_25660 [Mycobacterium adipatum]|uniref:Glycosyl transferase family 1 domain-containing protein n=1 Tax=Mycobacterium adipatum TaxID=1682113 RepID=A0A172USL7_9MYCO|nr:hypothetical protein A7U43_25660 [Mycobacterium adipatum]
MSRKKGIEQLLLLMESLIDEPVVLTLVGDGPLRERCIEAAAMNPAIRFIGPIQDRAEMAKTMAAHDLLVVLSQRDRTWEELFGIVIAEAMAAGLGVIASDHIGPRSLLGAAELGNLFADNDLDGVARLVRKLALDRDELQRFRAGHSNLADAFRLSNVADRWEGVIAPLTDEAHKLG